MNEEQITSFFKAMSAEVKEEIFVETMAEFSFMGEGERMRNFPELNQILYI